MASLFVIQGADQGKRFELKSSPVALGRESSNAIRLHDTEVSRRHAEIRLDDERYRIVDLGSANGTFVNGRLIDQAPLRSGDRLQLGQTVMLYNEGAAGRDLTARVDLLSQSHPEDRSAILKSIPAGEGSRVLQQPDGAVGWLRERLTNLSVMYRATQAVSHVLEIDALLPQVLELVFESIGADRGAILLKDDHGELKPKAVRWRDPDETTDDRMAISRTIIDYVLGQGQGVITSDAPADARFGPAESIIDLRIREAICVPVQGRHTTLGVLYADIQSDGALSRAATAEGGKNRRGEFSQDQLTLMVAIGHQAGLAIENTVFYNDKIQAERLAAVGQTIATLSHHIKNILQGVRGGSSLIDLGLNEKDDAIVRRGWAIVEKNQSKIYNLVMDMLSYSKDREPALEPADLNETVGDVVDLMRTRAEEFQVRLDWTPAPNLPQLWLDPDGVHRAVLNILTNAIDAAEGAHDPRVSVSVVWTPDAPTVRIQIQDNGHGIEECEIPRIFQVFSSTKGSRGTGLGLPVSQKIVREHGGSILVRSRPGQGALFTIELPAITRRPDSREPEELTFPPDD